MPTALKISRDHFGASSRLYGADGLGAAIRGLAIDQARIKIMTTGTPDLTDSSTGVNNTSGIVDVPIPSYIFDASATGALGASLARFNTAIGKYENAGKVLATSINAVHTKLGLVAFTAASGTQAAANTIPAQDKTSGASVIGALALGYVSGRSAMVTAKSNFERLLWATNVVLVAIGEDPLPSAFDSQGTTGENLLAVSVSTGAVAVTDGVAAGVLAISTVSTAAFLDALANNLATLATKWNAVMVQASDTDGLHVIAS